MFFQAVALTITSPQEWVRGSAIPAWHAASPDYNKWIEIATTIRQKKEKKGEKKSLWHFMFILMIQYAYYR